MNLCDQNISHVIYIYRRPTIFTNELLFSDRLADFTVTVSNVSFPIKADQLMSSGFERCVQYNGFPGAAETVKVTCDTAPIRGRYVYISLPGNQPLTLYEARVYGGKIVYLAIHVHWLTPSWPAGRSVFLSAS